MHASRHHMGWWIARLNTLGIFCVCAAFAGCGSDPEQAPPLNDVVGEETPAPDSPPVETAPEAVEAPMSQEARDTAFQDRLDTLRNEMEAAINELMQGMEDNNEEARASWEAWLEESQGKLNELAEDADDVSAEVHDRWQSFQQNVRARQQPIRESLVKWGEATGDAAAEVKAGLKQAAEDLNAALERAAQAYQRDAAQEPAPAATGEAMNEPEPVQPPEE